MCVFWNIEEVTKLSQGMGCAGGEAFRELHRKVLSKEGLGECKVTTT